MLLATHSADAWARMRISVALSAPAAVGAAAVDSAQVTSANSDPAEPDPGVADPPESLPSASEPAPPGQEVPPAVEQHGQDEGLDSPGAVKRVTNVQYPDRDGSQPEWLEAQPWWEGETYLVPVCSRPQLRESECRRELTDRIKTAADDFINRLIGSSQAARLVGCSTEELTQRRQQLVRGSFDEQVLVSTGSMRQSHVLIAFDEPFADGIRQRWDRVRSASRLLQTGIGATGALLLLASLFGYFQLDTATRGYYTRRLQFATAVAILTIIAVGLVVARWIPWL
jgi:hypothetical protein